MARVYKLQLEAHLKRIVEIKEPIMHWLVRWAAMKLSRFKYGTDGKTAYQRQVGKRCKIEVVFSVRKYGTAS